MAGMGTIRVGTSGWVYKDWRGRFYPSRLPASRWFDYYAEHFSTVEINNSFYRLVPDAVFAGWKERAPVGFLFTV
jgi:uncharacterized protein YecE (DUF72 family)